MTRLPAAACLLCCLAAVAHGEPAASVRETSDRFVAALRANDPGALEAAFDDPLRASASHAAVVAQWTQMTATIGTLGACDAPRWSTHAALDIVEYRCDFARAPTIVRFAWTAGGKLAGYFFNPAFDLVPLPDGATETPVTTGAPGWPLPASFLRPFSPARPPVVVFVHGSGAHDRDETIGPNKPLRDLAVGLAAHGIASLRYEKRTFALADRFRRELPAWTLDDQIVDDAVAAILVAQARDDVGPLFVVGHSEGAWLAPRIAAAAARRGARVAGVVLLAGNVTPLADVIVDQFTSASQRENAQVTPAMLDAEKEKRDHVATLVAAAARGPIGPEVASLPLPLDMPPSAWLDIAHYDPAAALLAQPRLPALLTFGERDFQVPVREKARWASRLGARPDTTFVVFPRLNHLLVERDGPMTSAEYALPGHVAPAVIETVAAWIAAHAPAAS